MYIWLYIITIVLCSLLGNYIWGTRGIMMGAGIGFLFSPIIGYIIQLNRNKRHVQLQAAEFLNNYDDLVIKSFPKISTSLGRLRAVEHTMLSISAIVNQNKNEDGSISEEDCDAAVGVYSQDCALDEKNKELGIMIKELYRFLMEEEVES